MLAPSSCPEHSELLELVGSLHFSVLIACWGLWSRWLSTTAAHITPALVLFLVLSRWDVPSASQTNFNILFTVFVPRSCSALSSSGCNVRSAGWATEIQPSSLAVC